MQLHRFNRSLAAALPEAVPMNQAMFQAAHGGGFIDFLPPGYSPGRAGYRPYRCASGEVVCVKFHQADMRDPT